MYSHHYSFIQCPGSDVLMGKCQEKCSRLVTTTPEKSVMSKVIKNKAFLSFKYQGPWTKVILRFSCEAWNWDKSGRKSQCIPKYLEIPRLYLEKSGRVQMFVKPVPIYPDYLNFAGKFEMSILLFNALICLFILTPHLTAWSHWFSKDFLSYLIFHLSRSEEVEIS